MTRRSGKSQFPRNQTKDRRLPLAPPPSSPSQQEHFEKNWFMEPLSQLTNFGS